MTLGTGAADPLSPYSPSEEAVRAAVAAAVNGYRRVFGERLAFVWMFGSRATGTNRPDSDVDLLAVLHKENRIGEDLDLLCSVANPIRRDYGVLIDGHPTTLEEFETSDDDFHHFVREEGRPVDAREGDRGSWGTLSS
ncbi:MAG: nucleotidyltransferase domain-containing protein [bacterium]|nr:nucleotidyltransferase domain-containing protein [Acidimicrobiia bacterium]MCY4650819.1 nucleotidyltransferase domain-containing protein [bacterium]